MLLFTRRILFMKTRLVAKIFNVVIHPRMFPTIANNCFTKNKVRYIYNSIDNNCYVENEHLLITLRNADYQFKWPNALFL